MGLRILLINPLGVDMFDELTVELARQCVRPDTEVVCHSLSDGVPKTPHLASPAAYHNQLIGMVAGAAGEGFDAVGISCCGDPAVVDCKAVSPIPITAPFEAMCATARSIGPVAVLQRKLPAAFTATMPTQRNAHWIRRLIASYGLDLDQVSFRTVPIDGHPDPAEVERLAVADPDRLRDLVLTAMADAAHGPGVAEVLAAAEQEQAAAAFFACTFWGGQLEPVRAKSPIPVLDPLTVVAKYTEYLATVV